MKQHLVQENGHLYYERLDPPRFVVEIIKDDEGYMFDCTTLIYADEKRYDKLFLALVISEAVVFLSSVLNF